MLEMGCVLNGLRQQMEIGVPIEDGRTHIIFCKAKKTIQEITDDVEIHLGRFGISFKTLATKSEPDGVNVVKIELSHHVHWDD